MRRRNHTGNGLDGLSGTGEDGGANGSILFSLTLSPFL
jgi:hypothetical protein